MFFEVNGATASQEATIRSILEGDQLIWDHMKLHTLVRVHMANEVDLPGDGVDNSAYVTYNASTDTADMYLERRLEADPAFFRRTVAHELGHVVIAQSDQSGFLSIAQSAWGKTPAQWEEGQWAQRPSEAFAEAFVDAFLVDAASARNASQLRVPEDQWDTATFYLQVFSRAFQRFYTMNPAALSPLHGDSWINSQMIPPASDKTWSTPFFDKAGSLITTPHPGPYRGHISASHVNYVGVVPIYRQDQYTSLWYRTGQYRWAGETGTVSDQDSRFSGDWHNQDRGRPDTHGGGLNPHSMAETSNEPQFTSPLPRQPSDFTYSDPKLQALHQRTQPLHIVFSEPKHNEPGDTYFYADAPMSDELSVVPAFNQDVYVRATIPQGTFMAAGMLGPSAPIPNEIVEFPHSVQWDPIILPKVYEERNPPFFERLFPPYPTYDVAGRIQAAPGPGGVVPRRRRLVG